MEASDRIYFRRMFGSDCLRKWHICFYVPDNSFCWLLHVHWKFCHGHKFFVWFLQRNYQEWQKRCGWNEVEWWEASSNRLVPFKSNPVKWILDILMMNCMRLILIHFLCRFTNDFVNIFRKILATILSFAVISICNNLFQIHVVNGEINHKMIQTNSSIFVLWNPGNIFRKHICIHPCGWTINLFFQLGIFVLSFWSTNNKSIWKSLSQNLWLRLDRFTDGNEKRFDFHVDNCSETDLYSKFCTVWMHSWCLQKGEQNSDYFFHIQIDNNFSLL